MMKDSESQSLKQSSKEYGTTRSRTGSGSTGGADHSEPAPVTRYTYLFTLIICFAGLNVGYDIGITGGLAMMMQNEMHWTIVQTEIFIGCINLMAFVGAFFTALLSDLCGRRGLFVISAFCIVSGVGLTATANSFPMAMVGRFWIGLGVGFSFTVDTTFIAEMAPPEHRGYLCNFTEIGISVGIVLGTAASYLMAETSWRMAAWSAAPWPILLLILAYCVLPESPRWLIMKGRIEEAEHVLELTLGEGHDIRATVENIKEHIAEEERFSKEGWTPLLNPSPSLRAMLLAGVGLALAQQISGIDTFMYYSSYIFKEAGVESIDQAFGLTVALGLTKLAFTFVSTVTVDVWGRRPLALWSSALIFFSLVGIAGSSAMGMPNGRLVFMFTYMAAFAVGMGPVCRCIPELFPNRIRVRAMSVAIGVNRFSAAVMATIPLTLTKAVGVTGFFAILAGLALLGWIYLYHLFPESKGLTLEELEDEMIEKYDSSG